jgi:hypothetical protein
VHHPRRELLAAARRPGDQHAAVGGRYLVNRLAQLIDGDDNTPDDSQHGRS